MSFRCTPEDADIIHLQNLILPNGIAAPTVFGVQKAQPATLSLEILLREGAFASVARADALGGNGSVHYGDLSKRLREASSQPSGQMTAASSIDKALDDVARLTNGAERVASMRVGVTMEKGSLYSERGLGIEEYGDFSGSGQEKRGWQAAGGRLRLQAMRLMVLIGVNDYERRTRQPLLTQLELQWQGHTRDYEPLWKVESCLATIVQDTVFETLEALAEYAVPKLTERLQQYPGLKWSSLTLKFEKPQAVPWADAPVVEVKRKISVAGVDASAQPSKLVITKPYV